MNSSIRKYIFSVGASCVLAFSFATPSNAFPVLTNTATVNSPMPNMVTDVRYYGRGYGGRYYGRGYGYRGYGYGGAAAGVIGGLAAGAIIGSAVANSGYYYGPGAYYGPDPYAYAPAPIYVRPRYYGGYYDGAAAPCWPCY